MTSAGLPLDPDDLDLSTLIKLHRHLGELICKQMGHDWENIRFRVGDTVNTGDVEKCQRCEKTRHPLSSANSTINVPSVGDEE